MTKNIIIALLAVLLVFVLFFRSCDSQKMVAEKGFSLEQSSRYDETERHAEDTLGFATRPHGVLHTKSDRYRLVPVFKLNFNKRTKRYYTGSIRYHTSYSPSGTDKINNWNRNYMPGFTAAYGFNLVNLSEFDVQEKSDRMFFTEPVLINTIYFPASSLDTLNGLPVIRNYYMLSVYDEDTNADGLLNRSDLRRFYHFDRETGDKILLIPADHSVISSEYDYRNDYMYVYARVDENSNGQMDEAEAINIWWIDLADPQKRGLVYDH